MKQIGQILMSRWEKFNEADGEIHLPEGGGQAQADSHDANSVEQICKVSTSPACQPQPDE